MNNTFILWDNDSRDISAIIETDLGKDEVQDIIDSVKEMYPDDYDGYCDDDLTEALNDAGCSITWVEEDSFVVW